MVPQPYLTSVLVSVATPLTYAGSSTMSSLLVLTSKHALNMSITNAVPNTNMQRSYTRTGTSARQMATACSECSKLLASSVSSTYDMTPNLNTGTSVGSHNTATAVAACC
eukprot:GHRQ01019903.1.p2 GENE.GHRQ01019903.1~~GHRQ01019903.1.p2  ORF type:complete len:110 (-),score=18.38 GHRQ01019903.1:352-681(-)